MEGRTEGACGRDWMVVARRFDQIWCSLKNVLQHQNSCSHKHSFRQVHKRPHRIWVQFTGPSLAPEMCLSSATYFSACYLLRSVEAACRSVKVVPF